MSSFSQLVRFECDEDGGEYFADLGPDANGPPSPGTKLAAFATVDELLQQQKQKQKYLTVRQVGSTSIYSCTQRHC